MQRPAAIATPVAIYFQLCSRDELSLRCTHSCVIVINHEPTTHQAKRVMTNSLGLSTNTIHQPGFPKHAIAGNFSLGAKQRLLSVMCCRETKIERVLPKFTELNQTWRFLDEHMAKIRRWLSQ
jgi:hypothetical protein